MITGVPDSLTAMLVPIAAYWTVSFMYLIIEGCSLFSQYRLHSEEKANSRNLVDRWDCAVNVLQQQFGQVAMGLIYGYFTGPELVQVAAEDYELMWWTAHVRWLRESVAPAVALVGVDSTGHGWSDTLFGSLSAATRTASENSTYHQMDLVVAMAIRSIVIPALRLFVALAVIDTWQYFFHRLMHMNKWCYRNWHSQHHKLYVPYCYGALYGSRVEGFLSETTGAGLAFLISGMLPREGMVLFTFGSIKAVSDHSGYMLPWDPLRYVSKNNAAYHDIHHQSWGHKKNFSQPFFTFWDDICGTGWKGAVKSH